MQLLINQHNTVIMKPNILLLFLLLGLNAIGFGQNQYDSKGKKHGRWIVYLDQDLKKLEDSTNAKYYRYTFYDHGRNLNAMSHWGGKGWRLESSNKDTSSNKKIALLDGLYKWYDNKGILRASYELKSGEFVSYKEYYSSGQVSQEFDYTKLWEQIPHSYYVAMYDKQGNLKSESYYRPDKNGHWPPSRD